MKIGLCLVVAALGMVLTVPATAEPPEDSIRGSVTEVSRSAEVVVIEEDPSDAAPPTPPEASAPWWRSGT
jgi:hypothetical protein